MSILEKTTIEFSNSFESRTRVNGDKFVVLKDGAPDWMSDICMAAHGDGRMLPDDWRYAAIARVAQELADMDPDDWEDYAHEHIDSLVDMHNGRLIAWLASHSSRIDYADEAAEELLSNDAGIIERAQAGQYREYEEIWHALTDALRERAAELEYEVADEDE